MDTNKLENQARSHFDVVWSNGEDFNTYREQGGCGNVCYGYIWGYESEYDDEDYKENVLGLSKLTIYFNPSWLISRELSEFVLSKEMFGRAFLNTNLDEGLKNGFELNLTLPYNYLLGAMITLRATFKDEYFVRSWETLLSVCKNPLEALYYADIIRGDEDLFKIREYNTDSNIFPILLQSKNLKYPIPPKGPPSSEKLNLDKETFFSVWGKETWRARSSVGFYEKTVEGFSKMMKDEKEMS